MSTGRQDDISDDSFTGFEDDVESSDAEVTEANHSATAILEKDEEEAELERLVLGSRAAFREHLFKDDFGLDAEAGEEEEDLAAGEGQDGGLEDVADSSLFFIDTPAPPPGKELAPVKGGASGELVEAHDVPAWEDSDDERLTISLASVSRLRKLRISEAEDTVSGTEYARRLRQQYQRLYPHPSWAQEAMNRLSKRRRRSSASSSASSRSGASDEEDDETSALPLERFLRDASSFAVDGSRKKRKLRPETLGIQRTRDIPDTLKGPVNSLSFHPHYPILLSSSTSSILHIHHIAPTAHPTPNPSLTSVQLKGTPIRRSEFVGPDGNEIIFAGRRKFFHSWHLPSGVVQKVTQIQGHRLEQKTTERFRTSPCGRYLALIASDRKGGGMLNVLAVATKQWIAQARIDSRGGIADFAWWRTGDGVTILGRDGAVLEWSVVSRRAVGTWRDSGSIGGTVIALGGRGGPAEIGSDRWVAVGSTSGILNIYDRSVLVDRAPPKSSSADVTPAIRPLPEPNRVFEQLTTPVTVVAFSPDGQLLAFGSEMKKDALRLAHLPTCTVYRNWPTEKTPLGRVTAVSFGRQSDLLAVGNDKGKIRLWEILG
ncbi:hypothetical protein VTK73DRAFT_3851 [Phialemonium thermophilum]|uniref:WD40 repeat-like protein n=1 Tax=Phialemonium thermophilum TaxID=223376 RepID=A0ABR3WXD7_9PEZI